MENAAKTPRRWSTGEAGLFHEANGTFAVEKFYQGERIRKFGLPSLAEARNVMIMEMHRINAEKQTGQRNKTFFVMAAEQYKQKFADKPSLKSDIHYLNAVMEFIGHLTLEEIYDETLEPFIAARKAGRISGKNHLCEGKKIPKGVKNSTINHSIDIVEQILTLSATKWRNDKGQYWLEKAPKLTRLPLTDQVSCRAIEWAEQRTFLAALPEHLREMALFTLNTGVRDDVVINLQWDWITYVPELDCRVFVVPPAHVKGPKALKTERILIPNSLAWEVVDRQKGKHDKYIFVYRKGERIGPITEMCNTAWNTARRLTGIDITPHDLRATVASRAMAAGASDRVVKAILWHGRADVTGIYAIPMMRAVREALELIKAEQEHANVCMHTVITRHRVEQERKAKLAREQHMTAPAVSEDAIKIIAACPEKKTVVEDGGAAETQPSA